MPSSFGNDRTGKGRVMVYDHQKLYDYWQRNEVESMYDKHLLRAEIDLIKCRIPIDSKILDAGCGEGEGNLESWTRPEFTHTV